MERFLSNYKPPPPKKSKLSEEDQLGKKTENTKLKNVREPSIHHGRILLDGSTITSSVNGEGKMFCSICSRYDHANTFAVGNSNFKLETVKAPAKLTFQEKKVWATNM